MSVRSENSNRDLGAMVQRQRHLWSLIQCGERNFGKDSTVTRKTSVNYYDNRIEAARETEREFRENDRYLLLQGLSQDSEYFKENIAVAFFEDVLDYVTLLETERDQRFPPRDRQTPWMGGTRGTENPPGNIGQFLGPPPFGNFNRERPAPASNQERDQIPLDPNNPLPGDNGSSSSEQNHPPPGPAALDLNTSGSMFSSVRLDRIQVPKFGSGFSNWPCFHDMFLSLVHNHPRLTRVEKLWYLKTSLIPDSEACNLIKHLPVTEANYEAAWQLLCDRYENPRALFKAQMTLFTSQTRIIKEDNLAIQSLLSLSRECRTALTNFGLNLTHLDPVMVFLITQRLPPETVGLWETHVGNSRTLDSFALLERFLDTRIQALEAIAENKAHLKAATLPNKPVTKSAFHLSTKDKKGTANPEGRPKIACANCSEAHPLYRCSKFLALPTEERKKVARKSGVCFNCLSPSHVVKDCGSERRCHCDSKHHSLLHDSSASTPDDTPSVSTPSMSLQTHTAQLVHSTVFLPTALVKVKDVRGRLISLRALLDVGSEATIISERAAQRLGLPHVQVGVTITGISDVPADTLNRAISIEVHSNIEEFHVNVKAFVIQRFASLIPNKSSFGHAFPQLEGLNLADPGFFSPEQIDLILGSEVYAQVLMDGLRITPGYPTAQRTRFGWILMGAMPQGDESRNFRTMVTRVDIDKLLRKFWEIEEVPGKRELSPEEVFCENHFVETHKRLPTGRYLVRLPFKSNINGRAHLGRSRQMAINSFSQLERRFARDPTFKEAYVKAFESYQKLGYLEPVALTEDQLTSEKEGTTSVQCCYLPHHAVTKESSSTTKLRIVFDASRKTSNGRSLNDVLLPGPALHNDLPAVLTNWRFHRVVYAGDLEKMFLQIQVEDSDAQYQRVVWRDDPSKPLQDLFMNVVTFGTSSAPFLAMRAVRQLAEDYRKIYPLTYEPVMRGLFVDDLFGGAGDVSTALKTQRQLIELFREGGFHLRKWVSNAEQLLTSVPKEDLELTLPLSLNQGNPVKTLGLFWDPSTDEFHFRFSFDLDQVLMEPTTMRHVLATIARLFDPLGLICPVILPAKWLLRELREENLGWDDSASQEFVQRWTKYVQDLRCLTSLRIPRWLSTTPHENHLEYHAFSDASEHAYAAAIFIRVKTQEGGHHCTLLTAKSKIAPVKPKRSLAELELMGACMLAELLSSVQRNWHVSNPPSVFAWTDSEIVMHWLRGDTNRWTVFVANRVNKILPLVPLECWRYVPSESNPADLGTRGVTPEEIQKRSLWWKGPDFLQSDEIPWPCQKKFETPVDGLGVRQVLLINFNNDDTIKILDSFSSFNRLLRVTARAKRLSKNFRARASTRILGVKDLRQARDFWIRAVQQHFFPKEYGALHKAMEIPVTSNIKELNPFLDDEGLLRMRGRLENSSLSYNEKCPIILPSKSNFTRLLVLETHQLTLHGGPQLVLTWLRKRYWVVHARRTVRSILSRCIKCYRFKATAGQQLMAALPSPRVTPSLVFTHTGVDYAGPLSVKASRCRGKVTYKGYIAVFVCFSTKAIHLELAGDYSTPTFMAALKRFLARRPMCAHIYSDQGTNFVGASNLMKTHEKQWLKEVGQEADTFLANRGIEWHFNPPSAPHFGGLWEAAVKSTKYHLKRITEGLSYTFEEWTTLLVQIEGILNSRPLCPFTSNPDDLTAITPNHFLNGDFTREPPEPEAERLSLPKHLRELTALKNSFWRRWSSEYLGLLQSRPKWRQVRDNLNVGDLVLIKDDRFPPLNWNLGRVLKLCPGSDGLVRVASVKTQSGVLDRPIIKLCRLPIDETDESRAPSS